MHRVLTFDKGGNCLKDYKVEPNDMGSVFDNIKVESNERLAQWQWLHPRLGWQGFENRYA